MSSPDSSTPSDDTPFARVDAVLDTFELAKAALIRERKRVAEVKNNCDKAMEKIGERIDAVSDHWAGYVAKQQETMEMQIDYASKSLPTEAKEPLTAAELENLKKKEFLILKRKVYCAKTLSKEGKEVHGRANSEWTLLEKASEEMAELEKKQQEMISQWTVDQKMTVEQARATVFHTIAMLNKSGDQGLAEELQKFLQKTGDACSAATSTSVASTTGGQTQKTADDSSSASSSMASVDRFNHRI